MELLSRMKAGDREALGELLGRHLPGLRGYVRLHGGALLRAKEASTDIVQSVCREVLERLDEERLEYRGEAQFRAWLYEAALYKIKNRRKYWDAEQRDPGREQRAAPPDGSRAGVGWDQLLAHSTASPSEHAAREEEHAGARALLTQLPARYRQVVELAKLEGLDHAEIARRMDITEGASRMLPSRALARLATLSGDE